MLRLIVVCFLASIILVGCSWQQFSINNNKTDQKTTAEPKEKEVEEKVADDVVEPVKDFKSRITKKPFGIFITPKTSPVQPERFSGFHTGVDVEYEDVKKDILVVAIADGKVEHSGWVSGYGGVLAIRHTIDDKKYLAIYGHLNPATLVNKDKMVTKGEQIGILGKGNSTETDGERKHLHLALYKGEDLNLKGYVQTKDKLSAWVDPEMIISSSK